jgi:hypothetical protein
MGESSPSQSQVVSFVGKSASTSGGQQGFSGGGGGGGNMMDPSTKDYIDAHDEKTRAQNDARFAEVLAKLDGIKDLPKFWPLVAAISIAAITIIGICVAVLSYASDRFDGGLGASSLISAIQAGQAERDASQDAKLDTILSILTTQANQQ